MASTDNELQMLEVNESQTLEVEEPQTLEVEEPQTLEVEEPQTKELKTSDEDINGAENPVILDDIITSDNPNDDFILKMKDTDAEVILETNQKNKDNDIIEVNDDFLSEVDKIFEKPIKEGKNEEEDKNFEELKGPVAVQRMKQFINDRYLYVTKIVNATSMGKVEKFFELEKFMKDAWFDMTKFREQNTVLNSNYLNKAREPIDIRKREDELIAERIDTYNYYLKSKNEWLKNKKSKVRLNKQDISKKNEKQQANGETNSPKQNNNSKTDSSTINKEIPKKNPESGVQLNLKKKLSTINKEPKKNFNRSQDMKKNNKPFDRSQQRSGPQKKKFEPRAKFEHFRDRISLFEPKSNNSMPWSPLKQGPNNFATSLFENAQKLVQEQLSQALMKNVVNNVVNNVVQGMVQKIPLMPEQPNFSRNQETNLINPAKFGNLSRNNRKNKGNKQPNARWLNASPQRHDYSTEPNPWITAPTNSFMTPDYSRNSLGYKFGAVRGDNMMEPLMNHSSISGPRNSGDFGRKRDITDRDFDRAIEAERMKRMRFEYRSDDTRYDN